MRSVGWSCTETLCIQLNFTLPLRKPLPHAKKKKCPAKEFIINYKHKIPSMPTNAAFFLQYMQSTHKKKSHPRHDPKHQNKDPSQDQHAIKQEHLYRSYPPTIQPSNPIHALHPVAKQDQIQRDQREDQKNQSKKMSRQKGLKRIS